MSEALLHDAGLAGTKGLSPEELLGTDKNREALIKAGLWKQSYWYRLKQRMQPPKLEGQEGSPQSLCRRSICPEREHRGLCKACSSSLRCYKSQLRKMTSMRVSGTCISGTCGGFPGRWTLAA